MYDINRLEGHTLVQWRAFSAPFRALEGRPNHWGATGEPPFRFVRHSYSALVPRRAAARGARSDRRLLHRGHLTEGHQRLQSHVHGNLNLSNSGSSGGGGGGNASGKQLNSVIQVTYPMSMCG